MFTGMGLTVKNRLHAWLVWALWGVVVALVAAIALGLVANVL
jgi:FtsH-binding integral membrane protein